MLLPVDHLNGDRQTGTVTALAKNLPFVSLQRIGKMLISSENRIEYDNLHH